MEKYVYGFGSGKSDGRADMKNLLGGKGANLAEMSNLGIPVPAGFTITTDVCTYYYQNDNTYPDELKDQVLAALKTTEEAMGAKFGDVENPLLISVRSGARQSMPGMMETVLNVGLNSKTIEALIKKTDNARFVYDAYRRLITMYADVVMEKAAGVDPEEGKGIRFQLEEIMEEMKTEKGYTNDSDLEVDDLKKLVQLFKSKIEETLGKKFPDDPYDQLWGGISAVFSSWNGKRAIAYRRIEGIPDEWGTAVNVQSMVYGNMGDSSATGVAFTRNPATGENLFYGEWLINAQGEDVVAGIRTPNPLNIKNKTEETKDSVSLEEAIPDAYTQLFEIRNKLESHYKDMQDVEFTIQEGRLWMLQTRTGKRNGPAAVKMAVDMADEGLIHIKTALSRVKPSQLDELLHDMLDPNEEKKSKELAKGLPAGPGGASGQIVLTADDAEAWKKDGKKVVLVRNETSPEDVHGMHAAEAILTATGGMTSHAALVARGWGKCCIVGCGALNIDLKKKEISIGDLTVKEGDWISLNGSSGRVYLGDVKTIKPNMKKNKEYSQLMEWADTYRRLGVRTNADSPADAQQAIEFGAEGIGLTRTEHMFFGDDRIVAMRKMILADNLEDREKALGELLPYQREDFYGILKAMKDKPVTIRTLDPPLHEFLPHEEDAQKIVAEQMGVSVDEIRQKVENLHEFNPMLGHRGCRLGVTYPEITRMQAQAIIEAACQLTKEGYKVYPEIMIPLIGTRAELAHQRKVVVEIAEKVIKDMGQKVNYLVGTMIEIPRAAITADQVAEEADFFSFGTNDLTQMAFGYSRDDAAKFLPEFYDKKILPEDPFQSIDREGVGQLVKMGVEKGRATKPDLKIGICGEHGGDPSSVEFCHQIGLDYVSCSPYRVPIARLAAAQAVLSEK
ncbi:MAG: pyruvate, phosphate dikinase [Candidatus Cloacimonetes bacterium 4572_55]|nr:MAG: pyruvate, phosphate dikinase [Candidatus Cloacimonetes bacterium 4572_55]